jgi:CheY-like chemotaxis protein
MGHEVIEAENGREGVEIFQRREIDLIVTDLFMPPDGGLGVIKNVRKFDQHVKIVVVSGMALENRDVIFKQVMEAGATGTLEKPINPQKFAHMITEFLGDPPASITG